MSKNIIDMDSTFPPTVESDCGPFPKSGWRFKPMLAVPTQNIKRKGNPLPSSLPDPKIMQKILETTDYWGEPKINGHRCVYVDGELFSGRNLGVDGNQVCNSDRLPHILKELHEIDPDRNMIVDGEIGFDIADSSNEEVATILGADPDKAVDRMRTRALVFFIFDITRMPNGEDISDWPLEQRRKSLDGIFTLAFTKYVVPVDVYDPQRGYNLGELMDFARKNNWEGLIFKNRHRPYKEGARGANCWYKWKISNINDEQVFITHILEPEKYYRDALGQKDFTRLTRLWTEGLAGRVRIAQINPTTGEIVDRGRVGAWTDEQRRLFATEPEKWIGKVFDVSAFRMTDDGKYISPKFVRWRDDLKPEDCSSMPMAEESDALIIEEEI